MPKNIVVFSDGTGQDGGIRPEQTMSNVYKLYRACRIGPESALDPQEQVSFYDPGLGTDIGATALSSPVRFVQKLLSSVTGRGITTNIADCYEFIINHYEPGDRLFIIGFSRGAYTARCVANLVMLCGVPVATSNGPIQKFRKSTRDIAEEAVFEVFEHGAGRPRASFQDERNEKARRFREKYSSNTADSTDISNISPHFVGVFDTVAALGAKGAVRLLITAGLLFAGGVVNAIISQGLHLAAGFHFWKSFAAIGLLCALYGGWKWLAPSFKTIKNFPNEGDFNWHFAMWKAENYDRLLSGHVGYARSANAIDETRSDFNRVGWGKAISVRAKVGSEPAPLIQMWFAGNHSDVGGSYPEAESRLSDIALAWMIEQAIEIPNGLKIGPVFVNGRALPNTGKSGETLFLSPSANGVQHSEITGMRDKLETLTPRFLKWLTKPLNWKEQKRDIPPDAIVHESVMERFALESVGQCEATGAYRPKALDKHIKFRAYYPALTTEADGHSATEIK